MKPLSDYIQITTTNHRGKTVFTYEYGYYEQKYGWEAKAFIAHCLSRWDDEFEHLMDDFEPGHEYNELEIVNYWGGRFAEIFKDRYPRCGEDFYRDIFRSKLRSLILPQRLIHDYFKNVGYGGTKGYGQEYFERFKEFFGEDIKPLPADWIKFGCLDRDGTLSLSGEILELSGHMDRSELLKTVSWVLSGFIENFDIISPGPHHTVEINTRLCRLLSKKYPEYFGTGNLDAAWFEELYKAKFLSIQIPKKLLNTLFRK